jgi:Zn-dependent protease
MSTDNKGKDKKTLLGSLGLLGVVAVKFKFYILAAWKALAFLKLSWLLSPLISIGFYAMLWGWPFAFAIMLLLIIHEMGHWVWMKALGLEPKPIVFLPGVGAYVAMTKLPPDEATHAWVALAGPLVGGVGSAVLYWLGVNSGDDWLIAAGSTGFFLNLLQLVPAKPLDGGFVIHAVSKWFLIPGTVLLVVLALSFHSFLLLIIAGFSVFSLVQQFRQSKQPQLPPEFKRTVVLGADGKLVSVDKAAINPAPALMQQVEPGRYSDQSNENANPNAYANPNPNPNPNPNLIQTTDRDMNADSIVSAARAGLPVMKPAPLAQRITIAVAYLSLVVMLSYLYWLSHNELISVMPRH